MTRTLTAPPAYVWDRIEKILDEQDGRKHTEALFFKASVAPQGNKRKNFFLGSITGISVMLLILMRCSPGLKIN